MTQQPPPKIQQEVVYATAGLQLTRWAELCSKGHGAEVGDEIRRVLAAGVATTSHSEQWWLHRLDMAKSTAWQEGYEKGQRRPPKADASKAPEGITTTASEWQTFMNDQAFWENHIVDDEVVMVNGAPWSGDVDATVQPGAVVTVDGGAIFNDNDVDEPIDTLENFFARWRAARVTVVFAVEADSDMAANVKAAVIAAGGRVL